jgi:hypothetical protein
MIALDLLHAYLGTPEDDLKTDRVLEDLERQAVAYVQRITGRYFGPLAEVTEVIPGFRCWTWRHARCRVGERLYLTDLPAQTVDEAEAPLPLAVVEYGEAGAELLEPLAGVVVRQQGLEAWLVRTDGGSWNIQNEYHVTYTRGYPEDGEPDDIRRFVIAWVARQWSMRGRDGIASETIGGYSYTMAKDQTGNVAEMDAIIAAWIRPVIA